MQNKMPESSTVSKDESQLVTFLLKEEEFGFDIMLVQEIIRVPKMAQVPHTPRYVEGIANLRGVILPIIDVCTRFGMERSEETDGTRVLVVDIEGTKTGLRVDRVKQVMHVMRSGMEPPPGAIRGGTIDCLEGVVKLDNGRRIIMALNAARVCQIDRIARNDESIPVADNRPSASDPVLPRNADVPGIVQMVTFRIAKEEFAFRMEHVREILRVRTPTQVPDVPDHVLGVLTVRGQVLPIVDLRLLLQRQSFAEEAARECGEIRESYKNWLARSVSLGEDQADRSPAERLRAWVSGATSSSQILNEILSNARGLNERLIKQVQTGVALEEIHATAYQVDAVLAQFEREVIANIHEDQRIIVVDVNGLVFGFVVDRVKEVLSVPCDLLDSPPMVHSRGGIELEAIAKLNNGNRLIMLLDATRMVDDHRTDDIRTEPLPEGVAETMARASKETGVAPASSEVQLLTFMFGDEEFGVPISKIKEIDRLQKITMVPTAAHFVEGVTNLRGEVIPVLDTRKRFGLQAKEHDDRTRIIIVELSGMKTGLIVDSVREVLRLSKQDIAPPPEAIQSSIDQQFVSGIGKAESGRRMVLLLDVEKILANARGGGID